MKKYLFIATALVALASCTSDDFVGENNPAEESANGAIAFGFDLQNITRGEIAGNAAATLLGNNFYVTGTKGTEAATSPSPTLVFDNYLVHYGVNTAGTTTSNTANWEYVGITPGTDSYANYAKLSALNTQTIKFWDYSAAQYDFLAFSTGSKKAVSKTEFTGDNAIGNDEIGVTAMKYGTNLDVSSTTPIAYTFYIPSVDALKEVYITDITEVEKANYGKEVTLKFKNLGSKVRIALYETIPGYSVKDVVFYKFDGTKDFTDGDNNTTNDEDFKSSEVALISADTYGLPTKGTISVSFPHVGTNYQSGATNAKKDYNKATATITPVTASSTKYMTFSNLTNKAGKEGYEAEENCYLGRSLPNATFAGSADAGYYQTVFPISTSSPLTLRVDYTLVPIDGAAETIKVYGAKAVVPSTYTKWLPNYAYTYIFKISDNTNGWTSQTASSDGTNPGLFPITFDAVVAEATDATAEQTTITTVATPSITTYQQNHNPLAPQNEYSIATGKDVYVQVMDNRTETATLKTDLNGKAPITGEGVGTDKSLLYAITNATGNTTPISEATVMDALENQSTVEASTNAITGRNGIVLTPNTTDIDATVESIVNGVDDNPIEVTKGQAAKIAITASGFETGTYAYVYDYSDAAKTYMTFYQPTGAATGSTIANGTKYITLAKLNAITATTTGSEAADNDYIYFSKTTTDGTAYTYSYYSVDGKTGNLPAGLLKVNKTSDLLSSDGNATVTEGDFVFDIYTRNTGKYAVKVIKIVA